MQKHILTNALTKMLKQIGIPLIVPVAVSLALPSLGFAQDANDVTLRFANGQDSISGTLTDIKDGKFLLDSSVGLVAIPTDGVFCVGDACPEETRLQIENAQVVLTSKDGTISISGDLIEIQDDEYVLATALGEQRIAANLVTCEGEGCLPISTDPFVGGIVKLTNGGITMNGTLLGLEDGSYILDDEVLGEVRVSASQFECRGEGCP